MSKFLNSFMLENRNFEKHSKTDIQSLLFPALTLMSEALGRRAFRLGGGINAAVFDSVMIGLAERLKSDRINPGQAREAYNLLLLDESYLAAVRAGTSHKASVEARITLAIDTFSKDIFSPTLL